MLTPLDFLSDLTNPVLGFLPKALVVSMLAAVVCAVVGCHVVLRGMTFIGDAVAHAVFPGLAVAFVFQGSLILGGVVAGVLTAILIAVFGQHRRLRSDSVIGVFFVAAYALGIVIMSRAPGYSGSLNSFLFGSLTGIPDETVVTSAVFAALVLALLFWLHRDLVAVGMDRGYAQALGMRVLLLDIALSVLVTLAVVMSVQTIGNVLVIALIATPAATARLLTERVVPMMVMAAGTGMLSAALGIYLSWALDLPTGGTVVLVATLLFVLAWLMSPRHGVLRQRALARRQRAGDERADAAAASPHGGAAGVMAAAGAASAGTGAPAAGAIEAPASAGTPAVASR